MVSAIFLQLNDLIRSESEPTFFLPFFEAFTSSVKILGGPAALPREAHDGLVESLTLQLEKFAATRQKRAPIPEVSPAINSDVSVDNLSKIQSNLNNILQPSDPLSVDPDEITEDMETVMLDEMKKLLYYLDPMHPLLANVTTVQSLGRNRGIKYKDDMMRSCQELTQQLASIAGRLEQDRGEPIE